MTKMHKDRREGLGLGWVMLALILACLFVIAALMPFVWQAWR